MDREIYMLIIPQLGSNYLMGTLLSKYCSGICVDSGNVQYIRKIKNSHVVLLKRSIGGYYDPNLIEHLRKQNNTITYIVVDGFSVNPDKFKADFRAHSSLYDLVMFPSEYTNNMFKDMVNSDILYHIWDPKLKPNTSKKFGVCYFGLSRSNKVHMVDGVDHISSSDGPGRKSYYERLSNYTCHYAVRGSEYSEFKRGTNTKLSVAAACGSNIICSRDYSFMDLIEDYDYYVDGVDEISEMLNRAKAEYGTKKWRGNLVKLEAVKAATSPAAIGERLKNHLQKLG